MKTKILLPFLTLSSALLLTGCEIGDNQLIVTSDRQEIANPNPVPRDYKKINARHKILMAIIDYGVDYNHPELKNNLHFNLDKNNQPTALGHDFIGQDHWPSPYLAMTADTDPDSPATAKNTANELTKHIQMLISAYPKIEKIISPYQRIDQESDTGSFHGTHVAGLMTYDAPELGLISYRVLPVNQIYKSGELEESKMGQMPVSRNVLKALHMAADSGVKVINLSLAMVLKTKETPKGTKDYEEFFQVYKLINAFFKNHPDITFVMASGNSGYFIDGNDYKLLPCGISAPNVICVGALDKEGNRAKFTNVTQKSPFILAPGIDILSLAPLKTCRLLNDNLYTSQSTDILLNETNAPWNNATETKKFLADVAKECLSNNGFVKSTGTSMSSPIIARSIAKLRIKYPHLNGAQAIKKLLSMGEKLKEDQFIFTRIKAEKPSWYERDLNGDKLSDPFFF